MKMKNNIRIISVFFCIVTASCDSAIEEVPKSFLSPAIYTSEANIELAVNGIYDALGNRGFGIGLNFGNYNHGLLLMANLGTDQFKAGNNNIANRFSLHDFFAWTPNSQVLTHVWIVHYVGINNANTFIENVEPLIDDPNFDSQRLNTMLAEAKFLRAFYYFNLVRFYGDVPLKLSQTASLTAEDVVGIARSPVQEVYEQIEEDLLFAEQYLLLPSELGSVNHGRATKTAAWALLARFYNTWATYPLKDSSKWSLAAIYAKEVIDSGEHILLDNFPDIFPTENEANSELIFVVKNSNVVGEHTSSGGSTGIIGNGINVVVPGGVSGAAQLAVEPGYYKSFDPTDTRRDWTISNFRENADFSITPLTEEQLNDPLSLFFGLAKFRRDGTWSGFDNPNDYPLIRYGDVLLMYAEATANEAGGPTIESYAAINMVRERAFGTANDIAGGLSLDEFNQAVLNERSMELGGEDCSRWHDLIRWEIFGETILSSKREASLELFDPDTHKLFPIPSIEIDANPLINTADQNPGY